MASEKPEGSSFIKAFFEAKIAKWQAALDAFMAAQEAEGADLGALAPAVSVDAGYPIDLPKGAFHNKSVPVCVELYLSAGKVRRTNKEIAAALDKGGVVSYAKNFDAVINSALFDLKKAGKVLRFDDGWGMAEWYPAHIRASASNGAPKAPKKKTKKTKKRTHNAAANPPAKPAAKPVADRTEDLPHSKPGAA